MTLKITHKLSDWSFTAKVERVSFGRQWIFADEKRDDGTTERIGIRVDHMNYNYEILED